MKHHVLANIMKICFQTSTSSQQDFTVRVGVQHSVKFDVITLGPDKLKCFTWWHKK